MPLAPTASSVRPAAWRCCYRAREQARAARAGLRLFADAVGLVVAIGVGYAMPR